MKLNVGCGKKFDLEYFNIDLYEELVADKLMSAINLDFEDNSCEEVKAIQIIEHLSFFEAIYALNEFFRVLQLKGKLIIEIPDLIRACQAFLNSNNEQKKEVLGWIYGVPDKGLQHKFCFPEYLLTELLENTGFTNIKTSKYTNLETIPILRFECYKPESWENAEIFQILAIMHKILQSDNHVDFTNSLLIKEQEDLLSLCQIRLLEFQKKKKKEILFDMFIESLIRWPYLVKILLEVLNASYPILKTDIKRISYVADLLIRIDFPNVLCNLLKEAPDYPGTQRIAFFSIESFARGIVRSLIYNTEGKDKLIKKLEDQSTQIEYPEIIFFSSKILEKKASDYFYLGIKAFYKENYTIAYNRFLRAIKLYRDDFWYFWNLAKILVILNRKTEAIRYYKKTARLVKLTKIKDKKTIQSEIKKELYSVKNNKISTKGFRPILSV